MKLTTVRINDFAKGFDCGCEPKHCNVDLKNGSLRRARGYGRYYPKRIYYNDVQYQIRDIFICYSEAYSADETFARLMAVATNGTQTAIFHYANDDWQSIESGISPYAMSSVNCFFGGERKLLMFNAGDGLYTYDFNTSEVGYVDGAPAMGSAAMHFERLWGVGDINEPDAIYYSAEGSYTNWGSVADDPEASGGKITLTTTDGDMFTGIANVFDDVVIYRKGSIFRITGTGPSSYRLTRIPSASGAIGRYAIANNGRYSFFVGGDGIYSYDGTRADPIDNEAIKRFFEERVNKTYLKSAAAIIYDNVLYAAVPIDGATVNNCIVEYDILNRVATFKTSCDAVCFAEYDGELLFADSEGYINKLLTGDKYNTEDINAHYEAELCGEPLNESRVLDSVYITARGDGRLKLKAVTKNGFAKKVIKLRSDACFDVYMIPIYTEGRTFKLVLENVEGSDFEVKTMKFVFEKNKPD